MRKNKTNSTQGVPELLKLSPRQAQGKPKGSKQTGSGKFELRPNLMLALGKPRAWTFESEFKLVPPLTEIKLKWRRERWLVIDSNKVS